MVDDLTLERVNRLTQAVADLTESHAAQGRVLVRLLEQLDSRLGAIEAGLTALRTDMRELAREQLLRGNRVEDAFARALRVNVRLDEIETRD